MAFFHDDAVPPENRVRPRLINPLGYLHVLSPLLAAVALRT